MKQLIIISGADRVGKSTLALSMEKAGFSTVCHHGPPPTDRPLFSDLRDEIKVWMESDLQQLIWDRSYVCSYCLCQPNVTNAILQFEWDHRDFNILHIGVTAPWQTVARRHISEIQESGIGDPIVEYSTRMEEHEVYQERLRYFYKHVTMFPHTWSSSGSGT